ncbi:hypothetical protein DdX_11766 [Ditylenchus destructor]|uniref:Uncharacterized protein n=1 Tax=Ditylenchus destructor TaxID=166010 RepID=A0AAD4R448_9BILA|nr:hypothetical protein DdX_11766 [Ditylenchus destructor]
MRHVSYDPRREMRFLVQCFVICAMYEARFIAVATIAMIADNEDLKVAMKEETSIKKRYTFGIVPTLSKTPSRNDHLLLSLISLRILPRATLKELLKGKSGKKGPTANTGAESTNTVKAHGNGPPAAADPPQKPAVVEPRPKPVPVLTDESKELAYEYFTGIFREKAFKLASSKRKSPNVTAFEIYMSRLCHIDEPKQYSFNPREKKLRFVKMTKLDDDLHDEILEELKTKLDNRSVVLMTYTELLLLMGSENEHKLLDEMARLSQEVEKHTNWLKWSHLKMWTKSPGMIDSALEAAARKGPVSDITKSFDGVVGPIVEAVVHKPEIHEILEQVMKVSKAVALYVQEIGNENAAGENKDRRKLANELWHYFRDSDNGNVLEPNHERPKLSESASHSFVRWKMDLPESEQFKDSLQSELNTSYETSEMLKYVLLQLTDWRPYFYLPTDGRNLDKWELYLETDPCTDERWMIEKDAKKMAQCKKFKDEILTKVKTFGDTNSDAGKKKVALYIAEVYLRLSEAYPEQVKDLKKKQNRTRDENDRLAATPGRINSSRKRALNLVNIVLDLEEKENDSKDRFR